MDTKWFIENHGNSMTTNGTISQNIRFFPWEKYVIQPIHLFLYKLLIV